MQGYGQVLPLSKRQCWPILDANPQGGRAYWTKANSQVPHKADWVLEKVQCRVLLRIV